MRYFKSDLTWSETAVGITCGMTPTAIQYESDTGWNLLTDKTQSAYLSLLTRLPTFMTAMSSSSWMKKRVRQGARSVRYLDRWDDTWTRDSHGLRAAVLPETSFYDGGWIIYEFCQQGCSSSSQQRRQAAQTKRCAYTHTCSLLQGGNGSIALSASVIRDYKIIMQTYPFRCWEGVSCGRWLRQANCSQSRLIGSSLAQRLQVIYFMIGYD